MTHDRVVVAGALGLVGRATVEHFEDRDDWDVVGLSRRKPDFETTAEFRSVDLRDRTACERELADLDDVTHLVYAALYEKPALAAGWIDPEHEAVNLAMLRNVVEVLDEASPGLRHITVLQGTKAYGAHWGPTKTVSKEGDGRYMAPNFYYAQEDFLRERQVRHGWTWTALRPQLVSGFAVGSPNNGIAALGVYATICKEVGLPLRCPGAAHRILEASDTRLLARAALWAAATPECANQAYNITNGDCFVWHEIWPGLAELFGMEPAPPHPMPLQAAMADKAPVWDRLRERHGLEYSLEDLVPSWEFADMLFASGSHQAFGAGAAVPAILVSTIKARTHGFHDCIDSEQMFAEWIEEYRRRRALP